MAGKRRGRKTKLTPGVQEIILKALRVGNFRKVAAAYARIHEATLYRWLKLGERQKQGRFFQFCEAVRQAEAEGEAAHLQVIHQAAAVHWQASAWILERRWRERWGRYHSRVRTR